MLHVLTKSDYLLRETLLGLKRGGWMNWAAVSTVTVLLFLFGVSLQASWQIEGLLNQFGSQLELSVYLDTGVQAEDLQAIVAAMPDVRAVTPISKEVAWSNLMREMDQSGLQGATAQLNGNPLVDELKVKVGRAEAVTALAQQIRQLKGVDLVQYVDEVVQRISQLNRGLSWLSMGLVSALTLTAIAVTTTTIRLIVMARRREIEVMQLVGATTTWIYLPFILQGLMLGLVGALVAWSLILGAQEFLAGLLTQQSEFVQYLTGSFQPQPIQRLLLPLALMALGCSVGLLGSLLAVRRAAR